MFDKNLMLLDSTADVTALVTGAAVDFRGEDPVEVHYRCVVPAVGANTSCIIKIQESDTTTSGDFTDLVVGKSITAPGDQYLRARSKKRYRRVVITTAGTGTKNFGKVRVGVVAAGEYTNW